MGYLILVNILSILTKVIAAEIWHKICNNVRRGLMIKKKRGGKVKQSNVRESNFELLRIICMLLILVWHYMLYGGALSNTYPFETNFIITHFARVFSSVAVNCYVMISGYFLINSNFNVRKLLLLWGQVLFYSIGIYFILVSLSIIPFSVKTGLRALFPVLLREYWFVSCYIALYILSPFLNIFIKRLNKDQLKKLTIVLFCMFILWSGTYHSGILQINSGFSLTQFIFLYILAAYIRLYWSLKVNKYIYIIGYIICGLCSGILTILLFKFAKGSHTDILISYDFVGVVLPSIFLFMFIREISIKSAIINKIAASTLAVYLIHENPIMRSILYRLINTSGYFHSKLFLIHVIVSVLMIFCVSISIDFVRKKICYRILMHEKFNFLSLILEKY